jgi:hypothetical protein
VDEAGRRKDSKAILGAVAEVEGQEEQLREKGSDYDKAVIDLEMFHTC